MKVLSRSLSKDPLDAWSQLSTALVVEVGSVMSETNSAMKQNNVGSVAFLGYHTRSDYNLVVVIQ